VTTLYGIKNCDTVRRARRWLADQAVDHRFHDFRIDGLDPATLTRWAGAAGWETLLNRRGTTWRNLPDSVKQDLDADLAIQLMLGNPTLIRRPVLERGHLLLIGFRESEYADLIHGT
jgi:arsenate reductase